MTEPLPLFGYQEYAAEIMASRSRFGLHDEMGIGKTATTIGAINRINGRRGVIICPAMLRQNWINEFRKFSKYPLRICKGSTIHDFIAWTRNKFDVIIMSYEQAAKWRKEFGKQGEFIDFLVMDEAHYLKNVDANRTKQILGLHASGKHSWVQWACYAWHVTGTPMANDPNDIYAFLRFAKAMDLTPAEFKKTFFKSRSTSFSEKHSVRPELTGMLRELILNNSIRRFHNDVGMELPPIFMKEVMVDGDTKEIADMIKQFPFIEEAVLDAIESGGLSNLDAEYIATLRRLVGKSKVIPYAQTLKWELDAGSGKRVVFAIHSEPIQYLHHYLVTNGYDAVMAYGATSENDRIEAVERFMNDPECMVFIGNIKVAGTGLTLTESSEIDMLESDWSPAGNAQAIKRVHRYGQRQDVSARFITLANTIDETVNTIVAEKTAAIAQIDGEQMAAAPLTSY
jgi:SNF2 family DNA or RNA helicase